MAKTPDRLTKATALRRQAEELLRTTDRDVAAKSAKDVQLLVHELQVHQIELEMQNEELRRIQVALEAARDRYMDLYDFSPAGHLTLDVRGTIQEANLRAGTLLGIDRRELVGQPFSQMIAAGHEASFQRHWQEVLTSGRRQTCELLLRTEKGRSCWVYLESLAVHEESRPITHWRTSLLDVSDRKLAEQAMEVQRAQLEGIITSAMDAVITVDEKQGVLVFNRAAEFMFGCQAADVIGQPLDRFIPERYRQAHHGHMRTFALTQATSRSMGNFNELFGLRANGEEFPIEASISQIRVGDKNLFTVILRDITERKRAGDELRHSQVFITSVVENLPNMVFVKDAKDLKFVGFNKAGEDLLGYSREVLIGKSDYDLFPKEEADFFTSADRQVLETGSLLDILEEPIETKHKGLRILHTRKIPIYDDTGEPQYLLGVSEDITERKIAEEALQSSHAFTRSVLDSLSAHVCVLDKDGVIVETNDAWKEFARCNLDLTVIGADVGQNYLGVCRRASAAGEPISQLIAEGVVAVLGGSQPNFSAEYACHSPKEQRWFQMRVTPLKASKGVVVSHTDVSPRVKMGLELEHQLLLLGHKQEELESLTGKLIEAQEQERRRIARELHDDFNQRLAALAVELETLERTPDAFPEPVVQQLTTAREHVGHLSDDLHDLAYKLHPSLLEHVGLEVATRDHVAEFTKRTGLPVTFIARRVPEDLSAEVATNLFRLMQESLQNVFKHAKATEVTVKLSGSSKGIGLSVRDNGQGFDLEGKDARMKGIGLVSMQERMRLMGGFLRIHSLPADGTKVCAWIPRVKAEA